MTSAATKNLRWNAADYAANSGVQQSWARELMARLKLRGDERILDLGCGDGKVTAEIARAVPRGGVIGVDASAEMIAFAQKTFPAKKHPNLGFHVMDARGIDADVFSPPSPPPKEETAGERWPITSNLKPFAPTLSPLERGKGARVEPFDLIFSNAALHWVDDHEAILRGTASVLKPGGWLIISCGGKGNAHDVFVALRPEIRTKRWRQFFRRMPKPYFFYSPADYQKWLPRSGFRALNVRLRPKDATYTGRNGFTAWLRTTWLPYVQRVPEHLREEFIADVANRYVARHPPDAEGRIHVRMVRLEIDAVKI